MHVWLCEAAGVTAHGKRQLQFRQCASSGLGVGKKDNEKQGGEDERREKEVSSGQDNAEEEGGDRGEEPR